MNKIKCNIKVRKGSVVCLCGSSALKGAFEYWAKWFTMRGAIVLMPHVFNHCGDRVTEKQRDMLIELHKEKILLSDMVVVLHAGTIGDSTEGEISYAIDLGKIVNEIDIRGFC